jgi:hypothetical protein
VCSLREAPRWLVGKPCPPPRPRPAAFTPKIVILATLVSAGHHQRRQDHEGAASPPLPRARRPAPDPYDPPVLYVVVFAVSLVTGSLLLLALLTVRAFRQVKALGRTVAEASAKVEAAAAGLETIAPRERQ